MAGDDGMATPDRATTSRGDDRLIGTVVADKYKVHDLVARGGMGRIYRAEQLPLGRIVALKILTPRYATDNLDPQVQKRFLLEAATCARLTHPNTVTVFDYGAIKDAGDDTFFMVMEFVEGRTLSRVIREEGRLPPGRALRIAREICRSLREAHKLGIIHRDLKPGNVMLVQGDEGESVKVLDFGIAKVLQADAASQNLTLEGNFLGSPRYMAPEQIRHVEADGRTDIYALGIVMYEMITGRVPFDGDVAVKTLMMHLQEPVPSFAERGVPVPPEVELIVQTCLSKTVDGRYANVDELRFAIRDALSAIGEDTSEHSGEGRLQTEERARVNPMSSMSGEISGPSTLGDVATMELGRPADRRPWLLVGAIAALLALFAVVGVAVVGLGLVSVAPTAAPPAEPVLPVAEVVPAEPPPVVVEEPEPPPVTLATLTIDSDPPGAEIWEGNRLHGKTPLPVEIDSALLAEAPRTFVLKLAGYEDHAFAPAAGDTSYTGQLKKKAAPKPKPKPVKPKPPVDDIRSER